MIFTNDPMLTIDAEQEYKKIRGFLRKTAQKANRGTIIIGWSGGIDSTVSLFLLVGALSAKHIHVVHMPYSVSYNGEMEVLNKALKVPRENMHEISIKGMVDKIWENTGEKNEDKVRRGNIMARVRMILLFDLAKKLGGLVCGTENRSEHLLGYFTRYGDGASDLEPIQHLYKTQVYQLARYLKVPEIIMQKAPSADLWKDQTDEREFGFTYREADEVLNLHFDRKLAKEQIREKGYKNADKILDFASRNAFKQKVPYVMQSLSSGRGGDD